MKFRLILFAIIIAAHAAADEPATTNSEEGALAARSSENANPESPLSAIEQLIEQGDYQDAVRKLKPLAKSNKDNPEIWQLLGVASLKKGDYLGSKVAFEKSLKLDAENSQTLRLQAELFISIGDKASARSNLYKLEAICPNSCEARDQVASALGLL